MTNKYYKLIFVITLYINSATAARTPATTCVLSGTTCTFSGVRTTQSNPRFNPTSVDNYAVEKINFKNSSMHTLTDEICRRFRNLRELVTMNLHLVNISSKALHPCKQLATLNISANNVSQLNPDIFEENPKLTKIDMQNNNLSMIQGAMFSSLTQLTYLNFAGNSLKEFAVEEFPVLEKLEFLSLDSNNLTEFNVDAVPKKFPNLKFININHNYFYCNTLSIMEESLEKVGILGQSKNEQKNSGRSLKINGTTCVFKEKQEKDPGSKEKPKTRWGIIIGIGLIIAVIGFIIYLRYYKKRNPVSQTDTAISFASTTSMPGSAGDKSSSENLLSEH